MKPQARRLPDRGTRQLPIRARSALGRVVGAAKYHNGLAAHNANGRPRRRLVLPGPPSHLTPPLLPDPRARVYRSRPERPIVESTWLIGEHARYHGILAPRAVWRDAVIPAGRAASSGSATCSRHPCRREAGQAGPTSSREQARSPRPTPRSARGGSAAGKSSRSLRPSRYYTWAELMRRVFELDVLECPDCHGPLRILSAIHPPEATRAILEHLGLPSRAPPIAPATADEGFPSDYADVLDS